MENEVLILNCGHAIKTALTIKGKTACWLGKQLKISNPRAYAMLKSQDMLVSTIERIAEIFGVTATELLELGYMTEKEFQEWLEVNHTKKPH